MAYKAAEERYSEMEYRRCGDSGLLLPVISLGLWQNFGKADDLENCRDIIHTAFDHGITHFDLANNYGPPPGEAEKTFGKILKQDLKSYRDELIISTKAGWKMWEGPYGDLGSKKYMVASLDQSLSRMKLDYVDIYYHHRPDPDTKLEETMSALSLLVKQGKALYAGISGYQPAEALKAFRILKENNTPCILHQPKYSMLNRWVETELLDMLNQEKVGCITFSSLAQGLLTDKYLHGIPAKSRAGRKLPNGAVTAEAITPELIEKMKKLNVIAANRDQTLAQMAISWVLKDHRVTSVILGASKAGQVKEILKIIGNYNFSTTELMQIDGILANVTV